MLLTGNCDIVNPVNDAQIAQAVERETENLCVVGSTPTLGTIGVFFMNSFDNRQDALDVTSSCFVFASAGSGKTKILVDRYVKSLVYGISPQDILNVTYSNAAVCELEERISGILKQLYLNKDNFTQRYMQDTLNMTNISKQDIEKASELFFKFQDNLSQLKILTIHSFCQSLLQQFPLEADLFPDFRILDETEGLNFISQAKEGVLNRLSDDIIKNLLCNFSLTTLEDFINKIYQNLPRFIDFFSENKTLEIYRTKALDLFNIKCDTENEGSCQFTVRQKEFIAKFLANKNLEEVYLTKDGTLRKKIPFQNETISKEISVIVYENYIMRNKSKTLETTCSFLKLAQQIVEEYQRIKIENHVLDFSDVLYKTKYLLTKSCAKEFIISKICSQIKSIMIDEAQDLSPLQWELIRLFADDIYFDPCSQKTIFVVGDIKQSIYRFQGADCDMLSKTFVDTANIFQKMNKKVKEIYLNVNYRSLPKVLESVDKFFEKKNSKNLSSEAIKYQKHVPFRHSEQGNVEIINIEEYETDLQKKSEKIAFDISQRMTDNSLILTRSRNELSKNVVQNLTKLGIKVAPLDGLKLSQNLIIMDLLALADFCINGNNDYALCCTLKSPYIFDEPLKNNDLQMICRINISLTLKQLELNFPKQYMYLNKIISWYDETELQKFFYLLSVNLHNISANERYTVANFLDEVTKFAKNYSENIPKFLEYFRASDIKISNQNISTKEIRLSTIHGSKGLEADTVFLLPYKLKADKAKTKFLFSQDFFFIKPPQKKSFPELDKIANEEYDAEERELYRLLYVAMTRARNNLYIFTTGSENIFAETTSISDKEIFRETDIVLQGLNNIACNGNKSI